MFPKIKEALVFPKLKEALGLDINKGLESGILSPLSDREEKGLKAV
jgi:hypothetical protein